jgi:hypothetical protein
VKVVPEAVSLTCNFKPAAPAESVGGCLKTMGSNVCGKRLNQRMLRCIVPIFVLESANLG